MPKVEASPEVKAEGEEQKEAAPAANARRGRRGAAPKAAEQGEEVGNVAVAAGTRQQASAGCACPYVQILHCNCNHPLSLYDCIDNITPNLNKPYICDAR